MKFRAIISLLDKRIIIPLVAAIFFLSAGTAKANSVIYYTQSYSPYQMNSADLSAPDTSKVIYTSGTGSPYAVAVDVTNSRIYFSDPNPTVAKIFSAPLDGNAGDYTPFISNVSAEGIALDPTHGYIYYAQPGSGNVVRANLTDGSGPQIVYTSVGAPRAVAVDPVGGKLYIADYNLGKIIRSDLDGTNPEDLITNVHAKGLGLDTTHGKIYYTDAYNPKFDLVKANLANGSGPEILYSSATGSPGAIGVDPENGYIYFSDWHSTVAKIFKADLDGLNKEVFINNVNSYGIGLYIAPSIFTLSGTISDFQGGLLGATVDAGNGSIATTDAGGNFSLNLPNGSYTLTVSKNGYQSGTISVTLSGGNSTGQDLTLSKVPSVTSINPSSGPESGGTLVTLSGTGFTGADAVNFGTAVGTNLTVISDASLTVTSPAGTGTVDVTVTTSGGTSATNSSDEFTYIGTSLISIATPSAITGVANGTAKTPLALGLPSSVVLVTDSGNVNASVSWDVDASSYDVNRTTEQTFSVSGTVSLPAGVVSPNNVALSTTISVTVNAATITYTVGIGSLTGGSITASPASSAAGTTIDLNITPAASMQLKAGTLKYNTGTQAYTINGTSFSMPATDVTVTAEFEAIPATPNMAPTLQSVATNRSGTQILLSFDKVMADPASSAGAFSISVTRNSAPLAERVIGITLGSDTTQVILYLDKPLLANDTVQVSYTPGTLTSADGGVLGAINDSAVMNQAPRPVVSNTTVTSGQQNLAITPESVSSASGGKIIINVPFGINDTTLNVASLLQPVSSGTVTSSMLPELIVTSQVDLNLNGSTPVNVGLSTPTETTISAPEGWDGTINMPTVRARNSVTITPTCGTTPVADSVIEIGYGDIPLTLNHPARISIAGQAGKKAGYVRNGTFYPINTLISYDNYGTADRALAAGGDGYINSGANLVIYTKHFTQFVIYTETPITSYTVGIGSLTGGSITASPASATAGTTINLTITPAAGMQLKAGTLKYYDGTQEYTVNSTSFSMPPANITVTAEYEAIPSIPTSPVISGISPSSGPESGGTLVTLSGTGFTGATAVNFGMTVETNLTVNSDTSITVISPAGTGTVDVTVTTPGGTSATNSSDEFTYTSASISLISITAPNAITGVANGTAKTALALGLPTSVVMVTDQGNVNANVSWDVDASSYDVSRTTEQTFSVSGAVSLPAGVVNPTSVALTTTISVTVDAATTVDKTLVSITTPSAITGVANGTAKTALELVLPTSVVMVTDQGNVNANVSWDVDASSYDVSRTTEQTFSVSGAVSLPAGVVNPTSVALTTTISVTVDAATTVDKTLVSITTPSAITGIANGTAKTALALGLPTSVVMVTDQGNVNANVSWDMDASSYDVSRTTEQTFSVSGGVSLPAGVVNPTSVALTTTISVTVDAATTVDKTLVSITTPNAITGVANGTAKTALALGLPTSVVMVTDQGNVNANVSWDVDASSYDVSRTTEQTFSVSGAVSLPAGVVNPTSVALSTIISVTVNAATTVDKTLVSITTPSAITGVANGTAKTALALGLPTSVVMVTDQGNVNANVSWDVDASSYDVSRTTEQTFSVSGAVRVPAGVVNPTSVALTTTIGVTVNAATGSGGDSGGSSGGSGGSSGGSSGSTTTVTGDVINGHTGQTVREMEVQVTTGKDGKKIIEINSKETIVFQQPNGTQSSVGDLSKLGFSSKTNPDSEITLTADGTLQIKNLANGTDSIFTLTYDMGNGQKISIGTIEAKVGSDGKVSFSLTLIDPYGTITDPTTGQPVVGAKVTLYYANTERNKDSGKTPDAIVQLPVLEGFEPNNNQNPQVSDGSGAYGFMVFPTSDYYILTTKEGYEAYRSPTISVEQELVKWDFKMNPSITGVKRLAGLTSVDTALEIATANYTTKLSNVVLATEENYPDALAGSVLAYKLNAPILLVGNTELDQNKILAYLKSNLEETGTVYILGGTAVVSTEMETKVIASGFSKITRLGGIDRYETAVKIADQLEVKSGTPIVLVYGENYPDALSISGIAAGMQSPILLVEKEGLSNAVEQKIAEIMPTKVYIIGGEGVISGAVEDKAAQITLLDKTNIVRISGEDCYETSLEVAQYFNLAGQSVCIATGSNFPDALAGSVYAANFNAPIILADGSLSDQTLNFLKARKQTGATLFGGEAAISKEIEQQLKEMIGK